MSKLQIGAALGVALLFTNAAHAVDEDTFYGISLAIRQDYHVTPLQEYLYNSFEDPAALGLTTFSRSHPMAVGSMFGDVLYGSTSVYALSGIGSAESSATVQESGSDAIITDAGVTVVEAFQIDGASAADATVRFLVTFQAHGGTVNFATQDTGSAVYLGVESADQLELFASQLAGGEVCVGESGGRCDTTYFEGDARNESTPSAGSFNVSDSFVLEALVPTGVALGLEFDVTAFATCSPSWNPECAASSYAHADVDLLSVSDGTLVTQHGWLVPEPATEMEAAAALGTLTLIARRRV